MVPSGRMIIFIINIASIDNTILLMKAKIEKMFKKMKAALADFKNTVDLIRIRFKYFLRSNCFAIFCMSEKPTIVHQGIFIPRILF